MIDFTRAFDSAWERMMVILFRPFDLGKWCVIGLSAFLAGFLSGGNGYNGASFQNFNNFDRSSLNSGGAQAPSFEWHKFHDSITNALPGVQMGLIILLVVVGFFIGLAIALVIYWLGARGQFLFLDNVVRNRGAIAWPWVTYARQTNSLFFFYLVVLAIALVIFIPIIIVAVVMAIPLFQQDRWPYGGEIGGFLALALVYLVLALGLNFILFVFREFGVPLMFRNGLTARAAFGESMALLKEHPGSVIVFILLRIAIAIGVAILSVIACCFTCCLELLPYVGTVILLPALVYVRCFSLDCLAQFGPQYDVWTVDVSPPPPPG